MIFLSGDTPTRTTAMTVQEGAERLCGTGQLAGALLELHGVRFTAADEGFEFRDCHSGSTPPARQPDDRSAKRVAVLKPSSFHMAADSGAERRGKVSADNWETQPKRENPFETRRLGEPPGCAQLSEFLRMLQRMKRTPIPRGNLKAERTPSGQRCGCQVHSEVIHLAYSDRGTCRPSPVLWSPASHLDPYPLKHSGHRSTSAAEGQLVSKQNKGDCLWAPLDAGPLYST